MTREESKKAAEVMLAYAAGKKIEYRVRGGEEWRPISESETPQFGWNSKEYRIKPEITYRPFKDKEECWAEMQKHQPFGWVNTLTSKYWLIEHIASFDTGFEVIIDGNYFKPEVAFKELTFIDGTPFGIKEE